MPRQNPNAAGQGRADLAKQAVEEAEPRAAHQQKMGAPNNDNDNGGDRRPLAGDEWPLLRILGPCKDDNKRSQYLADWEPTWIAGDQARSVNQDAVRLWERTARADRTLERESGETLMEVLNPTSSHADEKTRQMIEKVIQGLRDYIGKEANLLAGDLSDEEEWKFLNDNEENTAKAAADGGPAANAQLTAAQVMRASFIEMIGDRQAVGNGSREFRYDEILVQWTGVLDATAENHGAQPPQGRRVRAFLDPLCSPIFTDDQRMLYSNWAPDGPYVQLQRLRPAVRAIITHAQYLLNQDWPLMFVLLFFDDDDIRRVINDSRFELETTKNNSIDDWDVRVNVKLVYAYQDKHWRSDARAMDDVYWTFRHSQGWITEKLEEDTEANRINYMLSVAFGQFRDCLRKDPQDLAEDLFKDEDWQFFDEDDEDNAAAAAVRASLVDNPSAGAVMRQSFIDQHRANSADTEKELLFDEIRVQYTGGIRATADEPAPLWPPQPPNGRTPNAFINAPFDGPFANLDGHHLRVDCWDAYRSDNPNDDSVHTLIHALYQPVNNLVTQSPYLLRKQCALMFISLFLDVTEIRALFSLTSIKYDLPEKNKRNKGWQNEAKDIFLPFYAAQEMDRETRSMDDINRKFERAQLYIDDQVQRGMREAGEESE